MNRSHPEIGLNEHHGFENAQINTMHMGINDWRISKHPSKPELTGNETGTVKDKL